jgi:hypothetical protein
MGSSAEKICIIEKGVFKEASSESCSQFIGSEVFIRVNNRD